MKAWFASLERRERLTLGVGAVLAVAIVFWGWIWQPLLDGNSAMRVSLTEKRQLLVDLRRAESLQPGAPAPEAAGAAPSLVLLVDSTARDSGLPPFLRTRPDGADRISVSFQDTSFDGILSWLLMLERNYGINVESASFNGARERGLVSGQLFLSRS